MSDRNRKYGDKAADTLLTGCVWLALVGTGASIGLVTLFIAHWILS